MLVLLAALALAVSDPPEGDAATSLDGLQQLYDQSCASREYGTFDDLCDQLSHQLRDARTQAAREARRQAAHDRTKPTTPQTEQTPAAPATTPPVTAPAASVPLPH